LQNLDERTAKSIAKVQNFVFVTKSEQEPFVQSMALFSIAPKTRSEN
jgi:hypothetical protein